MGQKHKRFRESRTPFPLRNIRKNPRSMYARVPQAMAQFVLKIEKLSHIMGPTPILEMARAYGLRPRLWLLARPDLLKAKLPTHEQIASKKSDERRGHFKPKASKHSSTRQILCTEATLVHWQIIFVPWGNFSALTNHFCALKQLLCTVNLVLCTLRQLLCTEELHLCTPRGLTLT